MADILAIVLVFTGGPVLGYGKADGGPLTAAYD